MEAFNLKFVGEVEKYPELYNNTLQEYSKRDATEKAWKNVSNEVNLSVDECKEKWRNLRSTFVKKLKPKPSGSGTTKKPYYLMEAMQFAIPFIKVAGNPLGNITEMPTAVPSRSTSTFNDVYEIPNTQEEGNRDLTEELCDDAGTSPPAPSPPLIAMSSTSASQGDRIRTPLPITAGARGPHGQPIRKRRQLHSDAADKALTEYFTTKQAKLSTLHPSTEATDKREEGIRNFALSLIPDLIQLNDVQLRNFKRKTLSLIDEVSGTSADVVTSSLLSPQSAFSQMRNSSVLNRSEQSNHEEQSFSETMSMLSDSMNPFHK